MKFRSKNTGDLRKIAQKSVCYLCPQLILKNVGKIFQIEKSSSVTRENKLLKNKTLKNNLKGQRQSKKVHKPKPWKSRILTYRSMRQGRDYQGASNQRRTEHFVGLYHLISENQAKTLNLEENVSTKSQKVAWVRIVLVGGELVKDVGMVLPKLLG